MRYRNLLRFMVYSDEMYLNLLIIYTSKYNIQSVTEIRIYDTAAAQRSPLNQVL